MFQQCDPPTAFSMPTSEWSEILLFLHAISCFNVLPFAGPHVSAFSFFCLFFVRLHYLSPLQGETGFFRHCSWIRPQLAHTGSAGLVTRFAGVTSLPWPQNRKQGHTRAFLFFAHALPTFPLRGKAGLFTQLGCLGFAELAHNCPTRLQRAGELVLLVCRFLSRFKNRTQAHTGPNLGFTVFSSCLSSAAVLPSAPPGGN